MLHTHGARLYSRLKMDYVFPPIMRNTFRSSAPNANPNPNPNPNPNLRSSLPGAGPVLPSHLGPQDVHLAHVRRLQSPLEGERPARQRGRLIPPDLRYEHVACTQNMLDSGASVNKVVVDFISAFCQVDSCSALGLVRVGSQVAHVCFAFPGHHRAFQTVPST